MDVAIFKPRTSKRAEACCVTDTGGRHWCFKTITNIKLYGYSKCFVCCGALCNVKVYFTSQDNLLVSGTHVCTFDHEREYRKRSDTTLRLV